MLHEEQLNRKKVQEGIRLKAQLTLCPALRLDNTACVTSGSVQSATVMTKGRGAEQEILLSRPLLLPAITCVPLIQRSLMVEQSCQPI